MKNNNISRTLVNTIAMGILILSFSSSHYSDSNITKYSLSTASINIPKSYSAASVEVNAPKFRVEFRTNPEIVNAGKPATLIFRVKNDRGATVRRLEVVHEKPMHLLIVSDDLAEFYHIHPEPQLDGSYRVVHSFPNGGAYKLFADFTPSGSTQIVEKVDLQVTGNRRERMKLSAQTELTGIKNGIHVAMSTGGPICPGEEALLSFKVTDPKTDAPVKDLQRYLGEFAHFVIISEDLKEFLHAHPSSEASEAAAISNHNDEHGSHPGAQVRGNRHASMRGRKFSPSEVFAHTTFPKSGLFKIWAQFKRKGQIITIPFAINVSQNNCRALTVGDYSNPSRQTNAGASKTSLDLIKVIVSNGGYKPSRIEVKKGQTIKIAFYRIDARNCGGAVVFPALSIRQQLPVGEQVIIEVTPIETGELSFTCGMGMLKGSLVVK